MNKVLCFDLDGTLINDKNEIIGGEGTINALKKLRNIGYKLVVSTGRLEHDIYYINNRYDLKLNYAISQNGAVINKNEELNAKLLDKDEALNIYEYLKTTDLRVELNTVSNRYWHTDRDPDFPKEYYDSSNIVHDFRNVIEYQPAVLFLVIGESDKVKVVQEHINSNYNKVKAIRTSDSSLEILSEGISKGNTVVELFPNSEIISIGDSENDFSMFELSKKSYYVGKGSCNKATYNCSSIYEALKQIIKEEENGR